MIFTQKFIEVDFDLAQGNFQGGDGGNKHTARGLRVTADIVKAGGVSLGAVQIVVYGLFLSTMDQLSTFGQVLTNQGRNHVTVRAGKDLRALTTVHQGDIYAAYKDGQAQPNVSFDIEAHVGLYAQVKPVEPISIPGSQDVATLMQGMAQKAGLQFENNGVDVKLQNQYFPGTVMQQIRKIVEAARIIHIVDKVILGIWPANGQKRGDPVVISPSTGPVAYPLFDSHGVFVHTESQVNIKYGKLIQVQSSITAANKTWRVYKLEYSLACQTPNGPWFQDVWGEVPDQTVAAWGIYPTVLI